MLKLILVTALAAGVAMPAAARPKTDKTSSDPNRIICKTTDVVGSRLATQKTCLTAAEWIQLDTQQRHTVERVQAFKSSNTQ